MTSETEAGRAYRQEVTLFVAEAIELRPLGRTRNLSQTGMFLETPERVAVGESTELAMVWGEELYACEARVVRHADEGMGLAFVGVDPSFRAVLHQILDEAA